MGFYVIKNLDVKRPAKGIEIRVLPGENMTMAFFHLEPGAGIPEHAHPHEQMGTVLKGSIVFVLDGEKRVVNEGEAYHVPPNIPHSGSCGESPAQIIEVFSPPREDLQK